MLAGASTRGPCQPHRGHEHAGDVAKESYSRKVRPRFSPSGGFGRTTTVVAESFASPCSTQWLNATPRPPFAWPSLRWTSEEGCQGRLLCRVVLVSATANPPKRNPESAQNFPRKILGRLRQKMRPAAEARNHCLIATIARHHTRLAAARSRKKRQDRATRIDRCRQREKCQVRSARSRSANHSSVSSLSSGGSSPSSAG